jgi:anaerobic ribonucleoside-triphosphate reductase activating protein
MNEPAALRINDVAFGSCPLLGPSLYVWVQGCPRRCPGCFNESTLDFNGPARIMTPGDVAATWQSRGGGLVLSGGEPFSQAAALAELCRLVRADRPDVPILVYTGYTLRELARGSDPGWRALLDAIDVIVDGPYVRERATDFPLAGSDNQRVFLLSTRVPRSAFDNLTRAHLQIGSSPDGCTRLVGTGTATTTMHRLLERFRAHGLEVRE